MLPNIKNLREISRRCQTGQPLDPDLAVWLGSSLDKFLEQRCHSVDEALGLRFALLRNLTAFGLSFPIAYVTVLVLGWWS